MEGVKFTIKALAAVKGVTIEELSNMADIKYQHLKDVSSGRVTMTARDLIRLHEATGVPCEQIEIYE